MPRTDTSVQPVQQERTSLVNTTSSLGELPRCPPHQCQAPYQPLISRSSLMLCAPLSTILPLSLIVGLSSRQATCSTVPLVACIASPVPAVTAPSPSPGQ